MEIDLPIVVVFQRKLNTTIPGQYKWKQTPQYARGALEISVQFMQYPNM